MPNRMALKLVVGLAVAGGAAAQQGPALFLQSCSASRNAYQQWSISNAPRIQLSTAQDGQMKCMDIEDESKAANATVYTWPCGDGSGTNQYWNITGSSIVSEDGGGMCLRAGRPGQALVAGVLITTAPCDSSDAAETLQYDAASQHIIHTPSGYCVDAGPTPPWCQLAPQSSWDVCNPLLSIDARAADIVSRISQADKITSLTSNIPALNSVNLPAYQWWSEATHGINGVGSGAAPRQSNTALPITTSCAFNRSLWMATGNQLGREARAYENLQAADGQTYWAPVINIVRDPRWGRNIECAGEDPFLSGQYAVNFVKGFQQAPEDPYTLQASACCKHFVANELEQWNGTDRHHFNAIISQQDLVDSYLPSFQACVEEGSVSGVMCSYNAVNGVPSCANTWLLKDLLRGEWQFDGYVTADCDAEWDVYQNHHFTATPEESVAAIALAGTDVDCSMTPSSSFMTRYAQQALQNGNITMADVDALLLRQFRVRIRLGFFDPPGPLSTIGADQVCSAAAIELARDGARQGTVMLKNTGATLPLADPSTFKKVLIIGPNGGITDTISYYGSYSPCNGTVTPVNAIQERIPGATFISGVPDVGSNDTSGVAAAAAAAASADLVFLVLGSDLSLEKEQLDRLTTAFSGGQLALIDAVAAAAKCPVVALVLSGGAMDVTPLLNNANVGAVLHAGQPSVQIVGTIDIAFGKTPSGAPAVPAGRLSQMIYGANFINEVSMFDFGMRPGPSAWPPGTNPGRTHRFYTGANKVLPFGFGLAFTNFTYTPVQPSSTVDLSAARQALAGDVTIGHIPAGLKATAADFWVNVTNTGAVDSDDVVLGFLVPPGAGTNGVPLEELFGFERVFIPAGQTVTVYLGAQGWSFTQAQDDGTRAVWPGEYTVRFGVAETAKHGMGFAELKVTAV